MQGPPCALRFLSLSPAARVDFGLTSLKGLFKEALAHDSSVRPLALWRSDRQRIAPWARRGDSGCVQTLVELDKPLIRRLFPAFVAIWPGDTGVLRSRWPVQRAVHLPQMMEKRLQRRQCLQLQRMDEQTDNALFAGMPSN